MKRISFTDDCFADLGDSCKVVSEFQFLIGSLGTVAPIVSDSPP